MSGLGKQSKFPQKDGLSRPGGLSSPFGPTGIPYGPANKAQFGPVKPLPNQGRFPSMSPPISRNAKHPMVSMT